MKVVTISSWLNFGRPTPSGRGSVVAWKFLAPTYYSQCAVFMSPLRAFFIFFIACSKLSWLSVSFWVSIKYLCILLQDRKCKSSFIFFGFVSPLITSAHVHLCDTDVENLTWIYIVCCGIVFQKHSLSARITTHLRVTFQTCAIHCWTTIPVFCCYILWLM